MNVTISTEVLESKVKELRARAARDVAEADRLSAFLDELLRWGQGPSEDDVAAAEKRELENRTRRQQIIDYLRDYGPHSRKEIAESTQIPEGTIGFEMRDRDTFVPLEDGRWALVEAVSNPYRVKLRAEIRKSVEGIAGGLPENTDGAPF